MFKITTLIAAFLLSSLLATNLFADDIKLPAPKKEGGEGIFTLLERRASGTRTAFPTGAISLDELATVLWAASGQNRDGKGWTVPIAKGSPPYVKIYVVKADGAFKYDWKSHSLLEVTKDNVMANVSGDDFVIKSSAILVFVVDGENLGPLSQVPDPSLIAGALGGAMSQNVYLAVDSLSLATRYLMTLKKDGAIEKLKLSQKDQPIFIMPLSRK
ncbi:MAG: SagB/ThcOx family dehydrogenase [Deltaproteobacteria bacterium]|jgi:hypothetical protein|nr:SagB/ThcOx family dehydrogenase [Deltaproteobacteria bacterium]